MGFFKMFRSPKTNITLEIPNHTIELGEERRYQISVSSEEEFDATEVRAELRCIERIRRERWVYSERARRKVRQIYWDQATLHSDDLVANGKIHIVPGFRRTFPLTVNIPAGGRESFDGLDSNVTWSIKGVVAVDGRPDAVGETIELQVVKPGQGPKTEKKMIPCKYCETNFPESESSCPICGAPRK